MNKVTLLNNEDSTQAQSVCRGQIYSRVSVSGELLYYIVCKSDSGYYLFCLSDGERWSSCATDINKVFGHFSSRKEFSLVKEPIILTPTID